MEWKIQSQMSHRISSTTEHKYDILVSTIYIYQTVLSKFPAIVASLGYIWWPHSRPHTKWKYWRQEEVQRLFKQMVASIMMYWTFFLLWQLVLQPHDPQPDYNHSLCKPRKQERWEMAPRFKFNSLTREVLAPLFTIGLTLSCYFLPHSQ